MNSNVSLVPSLSIGVGVLLALAGPAIAQPERFPTDAEMAQLVQEMRQRLPELQTSGMYTDRRTLAEQWVIAEFSRIWAAVDPAIAPYLGEWSAIEESLYIYPTTTPGEVCILDIYLDQGDFYTGRIQDEKIYTDVNLVLLLDNGYLGSTFVYDNQPGIYEYANPRPLPDPKAALGEYYPAAIADFESANCAVGLPTTF